MSKKQKVGPLDSIFTVTKKSLNNVKLNKQIIIDACIQLVTNNGRPFTLLEDSGFKMILDPIIDAIGCKFYIKQVNIS